MSKLFPKENDVKAQVKKLLTAHGWRWWTTPANGMGKSGIADHCALKDGVFIAVETKRDDNDWPTALQRDYLKGIMKEGGYGFVVRLSNVHHFAAWLDCLDAGKPYPEDGFLSLTKYEA